MHETDKTKRMASVKKLQEILINDGVWGMLWYDNWTRVMRTELVGIEKRWDTFERYFDMKLG
jgi:peptide/nickel transport system substrate-binding protein